MQDLKERTNSHPISDKKPNGFEKLDLCRVALLAAKEEKEPTF